MTHDNAANDQNYTTQSVGAQKWLTPTNPRLNGGYAEGETTAQFQAREAWRAQEKNKSGAQRGGK